MAIYEEVNNRKVNDSYIVQSYNLSINQSVKIIIEIKTMDKSSINVFEVKVAIKEITFKISAGDVFNEFLYLGDERGNIYK